MVVHNVALPVSRTLAADYRSGEPRALQFFRYNPYDPSSFRERLAWLRERPLPHRTRLAEGLADYNRRLGCDPAVLVNIDKLGQDGTFAVIAGQQAGVLTGPLYTIYKAVHVIRLSRQLEAELEVPVVPVFWIAGEDHDIDEINHVYVPVSETRVEKKVIPLPAHRRTSASMLQVDRAVMERFAGEILDGLAETLHTSALRELLKETAAQSATLVDWFARIMARLFGKHGLILVESSSGFVRELEAPVFRRIIGESEQIHRLLERAEQRLRGAGYAAQLQLDRRQLPLFCYESGERLAVYREENRFVLKGGRRSYLPEELAELAEREPQRFSANVVSRPLMQEHLFPVLAFVGGPGEVAYWAYFDEYFAHLGHQVPVVVPRVSVTLLEGGIERTLEQLDLTVEAALTDFARWKADWEERVKPVSLDSRFEEVRESIRRLYEPLTREVAAVDKGLRKLAEENLRRLLAQVDFLRQRTERAALERHELTRRRIARVEAALAPLGREQERVHNVFAYLNRHGPDLVDRLVEAPLVQGGRHNIVYL